ncbi:MAG: EamA family transporter [Ruminococcaceae bacterium]|nr:EamA family transporter [Oscillospiraceae bacterium]
MKTYIHYLYVILAAACWGVIGLFNRILGELGVGVLQRVTIRNFGALLVLTIVFALIRRDVFRVKLRHLPLFLGSGVVSVLGLSIVYFQCQMECSLAVAGILLYLAPSFVVLMSAALWKAPITRRKVTALVLALVGCGLVSGLVGGEVTASPRGLLLGVASGFCYATYTIFSHYTLRHYDSLTMTYWTFVFAGLGSLVFWDTAAIAAVMTDGRGIAGALGLAVIATALPYLFYTKGLEGVESGKASIIANVEPVVGALVGVFVFGEALSLWVILGIVCVLGGVLLLAKE